uniref:Sec-independent protein translocase protein TatB n=1 Tax=Davidia involucrata TaxID=16924 RepID=A0A5B7AD27_DAVIN
MLGISYGELFLLVGATAALIGPKDLPRIARTAGRLAGRAIGYVQLARGQFESVMQQSQARQVHKELQDTIAQLEAIRYEIRTISFMNPGPLTQRLVDNLDRTSANNGNSEPEKPDKENILTSSNSKDYSSSTSGSSNMHSQATAYARLAESTAVNLGSMESNEVFSELTDESGLLTVLPVSAKSTGLLPDHRDETKGSDILLEAIVEAEVARNAKEFFTQPQNQIKCE